MGECPFCGSKVSEDLVTHGGTCPKCFAEIPGEEAPTDPGVEVREAQDRRDRRIATLRRVLTLSVLLAIVSCTGVIALTMLLWPEPEVAELIDFDEGQGLDFVVPSEVVGAGDVAPKPTPKRGTTPRPAAPAPVAPVPAPGVRTELNPVGRELGGDGGLSAPAPRRAGDISLTGPVARRDANVVLDDPDAIRRMIGERMVEFIPSLNQCYERRLKLNPSLRGNWRLVFTVDTDGRVSAASAEAVGRADREFEMCLAEHIRKNWTFGKISRPQPLSKTLTFVPG